MSAQAVHQVSRRGLILILSSPSGAGKTTLTRLLSQRQDLGLRLSISATTRPRRASEVENVHYFFLERDEFLAQRERGEFLESAEVHGNLYGTPRRPVEQTLAAGSDMIFDVDWQGTQQVAEKLPDDVVTVFILPPSMAELKARLERRAEDAPAVIATRLAAARDEIARWTAYQYVLVNSDLDETFESLLAILAAERLKRERQIGLPPFVEQLLAERG
jgi:guanylate kinase